MERDATFRLTASLEDYLEAIKEAIDETAHGHAHTSDIARRLRVKMPSVTNALGVLREHGYINYDTNRPVTLTELGEREALRIIRRHLALGRFLRDVLLLPEEEASTTACRVEHVIDDRLLARLAVLTDSLTAPHRCRALRKRLRDRYAEVESGVLDVLKGIYVPPPRPAEDPKKSRRRTAAQPDQNQEVSHDA